jgi:hypothetical protein
MSNRSPLGFAPLLASLLVVAASLAGESETAPLYRYEVPDENVVDGALFGYVLTSSPEAVVLLEARTAHGELTWHYMVSRLTRFGITFSLDERKIAEFPRLDEWPATGRYFHHPLPMPEYPFTNDKRAVAPKE